MATLNIKNLPDKLYRKLQARARGNRRSMAQEVIQILSEATAPPESLSIMDLRGLGKEVWVAVEPGAHVEGERLSWD